MTPFTAGLLEAKRQWRAGRAEDPGHDLSRRRDVHRRSVRRSRPSPSPTRSPSRCRWRSPRRSAPSSTPATGRSIPTPAIGPPTDEAALPRARRRGRAGADLRFHQCAARRRVAIGAGGRRRACASVIEAAKGRVAITTFSSNVGRIRLDRRGRARRRPRGAGARPLDEARHRCRRRARLHGRPAGLPRRGGLRLHPARQAGRHLHRQPGRTARRARQARARRDEDGGAVAGRHRGLLLAHHSRQREGDPRDQEPADRPGHQDHRGRRCAGPRLRSSAPQRAAQDV